MVRLSDIATLCQWNFSEIIPWESNSPRLQTLSHIPQKTPKVSIHILMSAEYFIKVIMYSSHIFNKLNY